MTSSVRTTLLQFCISHDMYRFSHWVWFGRHTCSCRACLLCCVRRVYGAAVGHTFRDNPGSTDLLHRGWNRANGRLKPDIPNRSRSHLRLP